MASGTFSRFNDEGWGNRLVGAVSLLTPDFNGMRVEASGRAESQANRVTTRAGYGEGQLRVHYAGTQGGVWAGGGLARVWDGGFWQGSRRGELGAWVQDGVVGLRATVRQAIYRPGSRRADPQSYETVEGTLTLGAVTYQLEASIGRRMGDDIDGTTIWALAGAYWLTKFVAVSAAAGRYARDPAQSLPGGNYISMGMRIAPAKFFGAPAEARRRSVRPVDQPKRFELVGTSAGNGRRVFRYVGNALRSVEIIGSFTDWRPLALEEVSPGVWELEQPLSPGTYHVNLRIDGGEWEVPPGLTRVNDDFNGVVGLIIVAR